MLQVALSWQEQDLNSRYLTEQCDQCGVRRMSVIMWTEQAELCELNYVKWTSWSWVKNQKSIQFSPLLKTVWCMTKPAQTLMEDDSVLIALLQFTKVAMISE